MDTRDKASELSVKVLEKLMTCGSEIDELFREFRELRLREDDLSFQSALMNVEHAFFMVVQSMNVLRDQIKLLKVAKEKKRIE